MIFSKGQFYLQIEQAQLEDDGPYECQVGGSEGSQPISSNPAWLNVLIPPSNPYFETDFSESWVAGRSYMVVCVGADAKPEAQIHLNKDGVELTGAEQVTMAGSKEKLWNTRTQLVMGQVWTKLHFVPDSLGSLGGIPPQPPVLEGLEGDQVKGGSVLRLVCISQGGNPLAALHWMKDGELLSSSWQEDLQGRRSMSTVLLRVTPADNQVELRCQTLSLGMTSPLSVSRRITVLFSPAQVSVSGSYSAVEGTQVSLSCIAASSSPPVSLRWWLGFRELTASAIAGEHGGSSTVSNLTHLVSRDDHGVPLTCEAFNRGTRFSRSQTENLNVFYPPLKVWLDAPPPTPRRSGTKVRLVCFSTGGNPEAALTWLKNGRPVSGALGPMPFNQGVSRELVLVLVPSDNMAAYRCDAWNQVTTIRSAETKLQVQFPAVSMKIVSQQTELRAGQTLGLDCLSGSSNPKASISWSLGALRLLGEEHTPKTAAFSGLSVSSTLSLPLASRYNQQRLVCTASSAGLSEAASTFYTLNVLHPPEFSPDQPRHVQVVEGDSVVIPLLVSANPGEMSCTWLHRKAKLLREETDGRYVWTEASLEIRNVTRREAGLYTVKCSNQEGLEHISISLDVQYAPGVLPQKEVTYVDLGATADLTCEVDANPDAMISWSWLVELACRAEGVPPVTFSWSKNNVPMDFENPRRMLLLNVSSVLDFTEFSCSARNLLGEDKMDIQLVGTDHPESPSSLGLVAVTHNSVTLEWIPAFDGGLRQSFRIRYQGPREDSYRYVDVAPPSAVEYTITGLAPLTTYHFSVSARNDVGESSYTDALTSTTQEWVEPDQPPPNEDTGPS
ncbi:hypothetical protein NHX12_001137, partial [Muraenolepis orangiensis]